jgi:hypothetical protein
VQDQRTYDVTRLVAGTVSVELDAPRGGVEVVEVASGLFEPAEHGIVVGRVFIPWHRVRRYSWDLGTHQTEIVGERSSLARVRVVLDDGSPQGETHVVPGDRFETGPYVVTVVLDDRVDVNDGLVTRRKLCVPWHHVIEFERLRVNVAAVMHEEELVPERPDGA